VLGVHHAQFVDRGLQVCLAVCFARSAGRQRHQRSGKGRLAAAAQLARDIQKLGRVAPRVLEALAFQGQLRKFFQRVELAHMVAGAPGERA
jgi:hypothetical protein